MFSIEICKRVYEEVPGSLPEARYALVECCTIYCNTYKGNTIDVFLSETDGTAAFRIEGTGVCLEKLVDLRIRINLHFAETTLKMEAIKSSSSCFLPLIFKNSVIEDKITLGYILLRNSLIIKAGTTVLVLN